MPSKATTKSPTLNDVFGSRAAAKVQLNIRPLDDDTILIEGDAHSLRFLAKLLEAQAHEKDDGVQFGPKCAGSRIFHPRSPLGLYLHRTGKPARRR